MNGRSPSTEGLGIGSESISSTDRITLWAWGNSSGGNVHRAPNADGSVHVYFGPKSPQGKKNNWVQTVPGTGWNVVLRMYGALEPWFNKTWRPGEIEVVK